MEKAVKALAPAKVNLHLRVYRRRDDGFHGLKSIFQAISLQDEIFVRSLKQPERIEIGGVPGCKPEMTTFYKAIMAFRDYTGLKMGLSVEAVKRIPSGGGLGGGSSDAAALLVALDSLWETRLSREELAILGAKVGSDVPFFFFGGAALVEGRGELITPIPAREDYSLLLVNPGFPLGTPEAFRTLDSERPDDSAEPDPSSETLIKDYAGDPGLWPFQNSFEGVLKARHPELGLWVGRLREAGALFSRMSGSGSTLYGVFRRPEEAEAACASLGRLYGPEYLVGPAFPLARGISLL